MADAYSEPEDDGSTTIKPVVEELVRTQFCFPDIVLLVDKIIIAKVSLGKDLGDVEAYRLYLTDRERSIQAVLKRRLHKHLARDGFREGAHIVLKEYRLATSPRLNGNGTIQYIAISDFYMIGEERRYESPNGEYESCSTSKQRARATSILVHEKQPENLTECEQYDTVRLKSVSPATSDHVVKSQSKINAEDTENGQARERESLATLPSSQTLVPSDSDNRDDTLETQGVGKKRERDPEASQTDLGTAPDVSSPSTKLHKRNQIHLNSNGDAETPVLRQAESPWACKAKAAGTPLQPIERPLRLSTLASVTGINRSRNKVVDILALIDSVDESTVKPVHLPLKRDIRITDSSMDRKVTVSIFVDPVDCIPTVGDIVLFRNLVTHDWKQGALNAYPKYCNGKDWYIPDPERVEGRGLELKDLKAKILATEEERRKLLNVGDVK